MNHFKFKQSIRTFNLSGMGCAASVIGVDLAMEILAVSTYLSPTPILLFAASTDMRHHQAAVQGSLTKHCPMLPIYSAACSV